MAALAARPIRERSRRFQTPGYGPCSPALPAAAASAQQNNGGDGVLEREPHGP